MTTVGATAPVGVGLLGLGNSGWFYHAEANLTQSDRYRLVGVCAAGLARSRQAALAFGCRAYGGWDEMLADPAVELVVIALPHHLHRDAAVAAAAAGKHVLVEKPMAVTVAEADAMIEAAAAAGVILTVHQQRRWEEDLQQILRMVRAGEVGKLWRIQVTRCHAGRYRTAGEESPHTGAEFLPWAHEKASGGGISSVVGPHPADALLQLAHEPVKSVAGQVHMQPGEDVDDFVGAEVIFESGLQGRLEVYRQPGVPPPRFVVYGSEGTIVGADSTSVVVHRFDGTKTVVDGLSRPGRLGKEVYDGLYDAIRNGTPPPVTAAEGRAVVEVLELALRSAEEGGVPLFPGLPPATYQR